MRLGLFQHFVDGFKDQIRILPDELSKKLQTQVRGGLNKALQLSLKEAEKILEALPLTSHSESPLHTVKENLKDGLQTALSLAKPYLQGLGLRIVKLGANSVEILVPQNIWTQDSHQQIEEGVLCSAGLLALQCLWQRVSPQSGSLFQVQKMEFERLAKSLPGDLRLRTELQPTQREILYATLLKQRKAQVSFSILVTQENDLLVAKINLICNVWSPEAVETLNEKNPTEPTS